MHVIAIALFVMSPILLSGQTVLQKDVIGSTASLASSELYTLQGTLGQSFVAVIESEVQVLLEGFWHSLKKQTTAIEETGTIDILNFELGECYPNPANKKIWIPFNVKEAEHIRIELLNQEGKVLTVLVDANMNPGTYRVDLNTSFLSSGLYIYRMQVKNHLASRKLVVSR